MRRHHVLLAGSSLLLCLTHAEKHTISDTDTAFSVIWNGPSQKCNPSLPLSEYGVLANDNQNFFGSVITLLYDTGAFPKLNATYNATPCWTGEKPCSWNPWGDITPLINGGVPQAANLTLQAEAIQDVVTGAVPDQNSSTILILDFETWRPLMLEDDDGQSCYKEYSRRLVLADPAWAGKSASAIIAEAERRFNAGARALFTATVEAIRRVRPSVKIGFYSQGILKGNKSIAINRALDWLWDIVDVITPSIYPHSTNASTVAIKNAGLIQGAIQVAEEVEARRLQYQADIAIGSSRVLSAEQRRHLKLSLASAGPRPAVYPYARALVGHGDQPFTAGDLATQIQLAAVMGAEGVILWGSSGDYHSGTPGCAAIEQNIVGISGPAIKSCLVNRTACAATDCSGHGRCNEYGAANFSASPLPSLQDLCTALPVWPLGRRGSTDESVDVGTPCRCDAGYTGKDCSTLSASASEQ